MKRGWETNDGRKENIRETMLTTSGIRFIDVPMVFIQERAVIMVLETNRDIENSPVRNTYSIRDGLGT
jgi:hypothetical protein